MRRSCLWLALLATSSYVEQVASQQIWDIWQTTKDRSTLFSRIAQPDGPINFVQPGATGQADISVDSSSTFQSVWGFGGSLTDSSALTLNNLKSKNPTNYWNLLNFLFSPTDGAATAGLSYIRVPIGASDFSAKDYSFDDNSGDTSFFKFSANNAPSYLYSVLKDIRSINSITRIHILPWSPPGWMKDSGTMNGGSLKSSLIQNYATYLLKSVQGFQSNGIGVYAISIQNEPQNSNPTYPTSTLTPTTEGQIGTALRSLLNSNGLSGVKVIGFDHNWSNAGSYAVQLMQQAGNAFAGVAFHCYEGNVQQQADFHSQFPDKEIYFTECTGTIGSDWWGDIMWYMQNLFIGSITQNAHSALMWNIALDGSGNPKLPGTSSCGGPGCRPIVTVNSDGSYSVNQEFYAMAQASKAILPRDVGGPWGKRVAVSVGGGSSSSLLVGAYLTGRVLATDWERISLVVLNSNNSPITATIEYRGMQARYTFPPAVTTLWWYAPKP